MTEMGVNYSASLAHPFGLIVCPFQRFFVDCFKTTNKRSAKTSVFEGATKSVTQSPDVADPRLGEKHSFGGKKSRGVAFQVEN